MSTNMPSTGSVSDEIGYGFVSFVKIKGMLHDTNQLSRAKCQTEWLHDSSYKVDTTVSIADAFTDFYLSISSFKDRR